MDNMGIKRLGEIASMFGLNVDNLESNKTEDIEKPDIDNLTNRLNMVSLDSFAIDDIACYESCREMINNKEPYFNYSKNISGRVLHSLRIKTPANERELLSLEEMTSKQRDELVHCGTLCWCCQHALDLQCEWFQGFHKVPGWVAIPELVNGIGRSYMIYDCPKYTPTESRREMYQKGKDSTSNAKSTFDDNLNDLKNKRFVKR